MRHPSRLGLALLPVAALVAGVGLLPRAPGPEASAQAELREAYRLVDTWQGTQGQSAPGSLFRPAGMDQTSDAVFVVETGNYRVQRFSSTGAFEAAWGSRGSGNGQLLEPQDVAVDGNRVFVTDPGNRRVAVFDRDGGFEANWDVAGTGGPWGIAAGDGNVLVTLPSAGEIVVLRNGVEIRRWGGIGEPRGIDVGPDGRVYVAAAADMSIRIFGPEGDARGSIGTTLPPFDIAVDVTNDLWVLRRDAILWFSAGSRGSRLAMFYDGLAGLTVSSRNGVYASVASSLRQRHWIVHYPWRPRVGLPDAEWRILGYPPGRMRAPRAIHAGADGNLWVVDDWPRVQAFAADGRPVLQHVLPEAPADVAVKTGGEVVIGETRRLLRVMPDGTISGNLRLAKGTVRYWLTALVLEDDEKAAPILDGNLLAVRRYGVTDTLRDLDSAFAVGDPAQWQLYWDMAAPRPNPSGKLYVVNRTAGTVEVFENGAPTGVLTVDGRAIRVAVGADDSVYVLTLDGLVWKLAPDGTTVAAWDAGAFEAGDSEVVDLAVDDGDRVYTVDRAADVVRVWAADPLATPEPPQRRGGACRVRGDKRAIPSTVRLGEQVTVRLTIGGRCPQRAPRADIMLVIDQSYSMVQNGGITATVAAARAFINRIDFSRDRVGVVAFNNTAQVLQGLTADPSLALAALDRINPIGGTEIALAFRTAAAELYGPNARRDVQPVIVLLTDGRDREADDVLDAARAAKALGTRVFTVGFGDVDPMVMVLAATSPEDYYFAPDASGLALIYQEIASRISASVLAQSAHIVDELPANMPYRGPLAGPTPRVAGRTLTWDLADVPFVGITLSYSVEPQVLGVHDTNVLAEGDFVDGLSVPGSLRFPVPQVEVLAENPTTTPTPTPYPTPTATPRPGVAYLPVTLWQKCQGGAVRADVALVMDTSNSMKEPDAGGGTKLEAAVQAARTFLGQLDLPADRGAVVAFNTEATTPQPLTGDRAALLAALDGLATGPGTRIDRGIDAGREALSAEAPSPDRNRVIVLLTDGRTVEVPPQDIVAAADFAKGENILLFTIGLGQDVDPDLLTAVASRPEWYFPAPDAAGLASIYGQIAYALPCVNVTWP